MPAFRLASRVMVSSGWLLALQILHPCLDNWHLFICSVPEMVAFRILLNKMREE